MRDNLKRMISYYKPYLGTFFLDMLFAIVASGISLVIPLVVGDITNEIPHLTAEEGMRKILTFAVILVALVII
ncbi:MAG: ABC transporter ATP-binding protein, partial [Clostridiales bacterium]|nr:ABC transporter ATP-binding protein [Clostridiales bacterium]